MPRQGIDGSLAPPPPPPANAQSFSPIELRVIVEKILYPAGIDDPVTGTPLYVLNSTALPSAKVVSYSLLLPHLLDVIAGVDYSIVFFAGGAPYRPSWAWMIHTYSVLDRDVRKRLKRLYIVHENWWVRTIMEMVAGSVSGKFRKKAVHVPNISVLATFLDIRFIQIPLAVYMHDRRLEPRIQFESPFPPIFGRDLPSKNVVPRFWRQCIHHLAVEGIYTEGIFRVSPRMEHLEILREAFDRCQIVDLADYSPHVSASILKLFLRCLPTAPLPHGLLEQFPDFSPTKEYTVRVVNELARQTLELLALLVPLLRAVAKNEQNTRMTIVNLARAITPSLVRLSIPTDESPEMSSVTLVAGTATVTEEPAQQIEYVTDPVETVRILEFNMKVFECLIYYWNELPCSELGKEGGDDNDGKDDDDKTIGRNRSRSMSSTTTASSTSSKQLPPPLPLRKFTPPGSSASLAVMVTSISSNTSTTSSATASPSPSESSTTSTVPSLPELHDDKPQKIKFSYSSKSEPSKTVTPSLRHASTMTPAMSADAPSTKAMFSYSTKQTVPVPNPTLSRAYTGVATNSKFRTTATAGGFRCISGDTPAKTAEMRQVSPYVTAQTAVIKTDRLLAKPRPLGASAATTPAALVVGGPTIASVGGGKENVAPGPVRKGRRVGRARREDEGEEDEGGAREGARKKGRLVEELARIYEERSQSAALLGQLSR
ncbi:uncharacterized protein V1518DRAFT_378829 [Limtongia smithiae]|uniref:uncharacterized protein n=1 Tax=Limtongia smithiae TaxID=1125753 RepID=UPI0034CFBEED